MRRSFLGQRRGSGTDKPDLNGELVRFDHRTEAKCGNFHVAAEFTDAPAPGRVGFNLTMEARGLPANRRELLTLLGTQTGHRGQREGGFLRVAPCYASAMRRRVERLYRLRVTL